MEHVRIPIIKIQRLAKKQAVVRLRTCVSVEMSDWVLGACRPTSVRMSWQNADGWYTSIIYRHASCHFSLDEYSTSEYTYRLVTVTATEQGARLSTELCSACETARQRQSVSDLRNAS